MTEESIAFMEANKVVYETLMRAGTMRGIDAVTKDGMVQVIRREWDPGYQVNLWCGDCIATMIKFAYTQYNKYLDGVSKA